MASSRSATAIPIWLICFIINNMRSQNEKPLLSSELLLNYVFSCYLLTVRQADILQGIDAVNFYDRFQFFLIQLFVNRYGRNGFRALAGPPQAQGTDIDALLSHGAADAGQHARFVNILVHDNITFQTQLNPVAVNFHDTVVTFPEDGGGKGLILSSLGQ